jgi:sugar phosphate isomerase/epimerase
MNRREFLARSGIGMAAAGLGARPLVAAGGGDPGMPVYVFSKHLQFLGYEEMAATAAEMGFDGVDLTVRPGGHVEPERVRTDLPRAVKAIRAAGIRIDTISSGIVRPDTPHARDVLAVASDQGISQYRVGQLRYDVNEPAGLPGQIEDFYTAMRGLGGLNSEFRISGSIQNHSNYYLGGLLLDSWQAIRDLDSAWNGCHFDISHAVAESAVSWRVGFQLLAPRIKALVVKDFQFKRRDSGLQPEWVPLGTGTIPWDLYWPLVKAAGLRVPVILHMEYGRGESHAAHKRYLAQDLQTLRGMLKQYLA